MQSHFKFLLCFLLFINLSFQNKNLQGFPQDFIWGTATAAYQIEGAVNEDGKQQNIWDIFSHIPGKTHNGETGDIADDSYHRYEEDIQLMKDLGVTHYRFSISWSRIISYSDKTIEINQKGIDYYNRLINSLQAAGIESLATLYHWDLPQYIQEKIGGWLSRDIVYYFQQYADICFQNFGDRVKYWITFNEPRSFTLLGYGDGIHAPGRCSDRTICQAGNSATEPYITTHNVLRAHAVVVNMYRLKYQRKQQGKIGITLDSDWTEPYTNSTEDVEAAERRSQFLLGWYADPIYFGDYPESMKKNVGDRLPIFTNEEKALLKGSHDFFGLNHYTSRYAQNANISSTPIDFYHDQGVLPLVNDVNGNPIGKVSACNWLYVVPWGMEKLLVWIKNRYNNPPIIITENGVAMPNEENMKIDELIQDQFRIDYFSGYLEGVRSAIVNQNVNVKGYFVWSLLDNYEWIDGYSKKFGVYHVDNQTQQRVKKNSAKWYSEYIKNNTQQLILTE